MEEQTCSGEDWYGRDFDGESFVRCTFSDIDLVESTSKGTVFEECTFGSVRLNASRHTDSAFLRCTFAHCSLFEAEFTGCKLTGSTFLDTVLRPLRIDGGDLSFVVLRLADLRGVSVRGARMREAAQRAAEARRRARRRRQLIRLGGAAAGVLAVVLLVFVACGGLGKHKAASPSASASAAPSASAAASFPPLPAGADPALATKPTVTAGTGTLSKLVVTPLVEGKGDPVRSGQNITVNYVGVTFKDGKEFDASWNRSDTFSFAVGSGQVIPGWDQGLVGVKVGSRVQLDIPANMAYGDNPGGGKPPGALRFVVDVLAAK